MDKIIHQRNRHKSGNEKGVAAFVAGFWRSRGQSFDLPEVTAAEPVVSAQVEHGRWIGKCPFCPGAEYADPQDHRFFCLSCLNGEVSGKWLGVSWPENAEAIEAELMKRPTVNRNWSKVETLADLEAETIAHMGGGR